jgi:DNA-binding LacI/PurR family transcriptional regulator
MKDVAASAGVSLQTVSNFVNGRLDQMSEDTQKRVKSALERLDYHPDVSAQGLRSARTRTLGFLVLDEHQAFLADPLTAQLIAGVGDVARESRFGILIQGGSPLAASDELLAPFNERRIDGAFVLLTGDPEVRRSHIERLRDGGHQFVLFDEVVDDASIPTVRAAERDGGRRLTEHLLESGHRRIAFVAARVPWAVLEQRFLGYADALEKAGIEPTTELALFQARGYGPADGADLVRQLLAKPDPPTAIIGGSDLLALATMRVVRDLGLRVPDDVAVAGFDDFAFAALVDPPLTTVAVPGYEMGRAAAAMLIERLNGQPSLVQQSVFGVELKIRDST